MLHNCTRYDRCINPYLICISICNKYDCKTQSGTVCSIRMKQNEATFWLHNLVQLQFKVSTYALISNRDATGTTLRGQGRVYWWSGVCRWSGEGVLVSYTCGVPTFQGPIPRMVQNSKSLCKIYGKGFMNCSPLMIAPLLRPYYISIC